MIHNLAEQVFSHLCHQDGARAWTTGGAPLALCARCTGVYAGLSLAAAVVWLARFTPARTILWLHGAAMLQVALFGFHLLGDQPVWLRTLSGSLFSAGAVYFLWLPVRVSRYGKTGGSVWPYLVAITLVQVGLQILLRIPCRPAAVAAEALALAGIAAVGVLVLLCVKAIMSVTLKERKRA